jgi:hypothetical protein
MVVLFTGSWTPFVCRMSSGPRRRKGAAPNEPPQSTGMPTSTAPPRRGNWAEGIEKLYDAVQKFDRRNRKLPHVLWVSCRRFIGSLCRRLRFPGCPQSEGPSGGLARFLEILSNKASTPRVIWDGAGGRPPGPSWVAYGLCDLRRYSQMSFVSPKCSMLM